MPLPEVTDRDIVTALAGMRLVCTARRTLPLFLVGTCVIDGKPKASLVKPATLTDDEVVGVLEAVIKAIRESEVTK